MTAVAVGDRVRIERDEVRYPSRGTWPRFRGKTGTVVGINVDRRRPELTEYGLVFGKVRPPRPNGSIAMADATWFKAHEIRALAPQRAAGTGSSVPEGADTRERVSA